MKVYKKAVVSVILCGILALMAIGCSNNGGKPAGENTSSNSPDSSQTQIEENGDGKKDFGSVYWLRPQEFSKSTELSKVSDYIHEQMGVRIEPVWSDPSVDKFTLMIATNEKIDAAQLTLVEFYNHLKNESLLPLGQLIDQYGANLKEKVNPELWDWVKGADGETYGVPIESITVPYTIQIRKDWLAEQNLQMPTTIDEFEAVMLKFKEAYQTNPLLIDLKFDLSIGGFFLTEGYSWWEDEQGQYLPPEMHPAYKEMLATLNDWYKKGIIHPENFIGNQAQVHKQLVESNGIGARIGWYSGPYDGARTLITKVPEAEYVFVPPLSGPSDRGYRKETIPAAVAAVNVNSQNPEGVIAFLDWVSADLENMIVSRMGIPDEHWKYVDQDQGIITRDDDSEDKFGGGAYEVLDINNFTERQDTSNNPLTQWYYDYWDIVYGDQIDKLYVPVETQVQIADGILATADLMNDVQVAAEEMKISIITGSQSIDSWDSFLEQWKKIGMKDIIEEKGALIKERLQ